MYMKRKRSSLVKNVDHDLQNRRQRPCDRMVVAQHNRSPKIVSPRKIATKPQDSSV